MVPGSGTITRESSREETLIVGDWIRNPTPVIALEVRSLPSTDPSDRVEPETRDTLRHAEAAVVKENDLETSALVLVEKSLAVYVAVFVKAWLVAYQLPLTCTISRTDEPVLALPCFHVKVVGVIEENVVTAANI